MTTLKNLTLLCFLGFNFSAHSEVIDLRISDESNGFVTYVKNISKEEVSVDGYSIINSIERVIDNRAEYFPEIFYEVIDPTSNCYFPMIIGPGNVKIAIKDPSISIGPGMELPIGRIKKIQIVNKWGLGYGHYKVRVVYRFHSGGGVSIPDKNSQFTHLYETNWIDFHVENNDALAYYFQMKKSVEKWHADGLIPVIRGISPCIKRP